MEDNNIRFNNKKIIIIKVIENLFQITKIRENILKNFWKVCMRIRIKNLKKLVKKSINKFEVKNISQWAKKGFRDFALNSKNGVKTPSWRILGIKKCSPKFEI